MTDEERPQTLSKIEKLISQLVDAENVNTEQMDRLFPVYGLEEAVKNHLRRDNALIKVEIERLTATLSQQS